LKDKINEIELNSKNKNFRDLYGGIKPLAWWRKILRHVKSTCGVWQRYITGKINGHFFTSFLLASIVGVNAGICQSFGGWIRNDYNSNGEAIQSRILLHRWGALY
jgi:hypothetical protein